MPTDPVIVITPDGTDTITAITVSTNGMRTESGYREPEEEAHRGLFFFELAAASAPFPRRGPENSLRATTECQGGAGVPPSDQMAARSVSLS